MSFNLAGLQPYTDQLSTDLITRSILKPISVGYLTVRPGLTAGTTAINVLGGVVDIKDSTCGFGAGQTGNNTTAFTQIDLVVSSKMLKEQLCPEDLRDYWLSAYMNPSAYQEAVPFEVAIADYKVRSIGQYVENTIWQGDGSNLDGLLSQIDVANGAIDGSAFGGAWSSSTAVANAWGLIDLLPDAVKQNDDIKMFLSYSQYSKLVQGLIATGNSILLQYPNITNTAGTSTASTFIFPGTNIEVVAAPGINTSEVIVGPRKYVFMGTGLLDDADMFKFYYDPSQDIVNFMSKFRLGTAAVANQFVTSAAY
jgi:hypothetical protein